MSVKKHLRPLLLVVVVALLAALLVRCGLTAPEPEEPPAVEETEEPEAAEEPEVEPEEESSVTIVIAQDPPNFNQVVAETGYERLVAEMVVLSLVHLDAESNILPELAAELPTEENGMVVVDEENWTMDVTWKLRDDIYWEDGEPVTADDVIFTWAAITDPETGIWVEGVDYTDSVEKVDDYTFVVHYNTVFPEYLEQFGSGTLHIWPEHYCEGEGIGSWNCNRDPLANGPYTLEEWEEGDHLTFVRNPNYFEEGKPSIDRVYMRIVPEEAVRQEMVLQGEADVDFWIIEPVREAYEEAGNIQLSYGLYGRWLVRLWPNQAARGEIDPVEHPHPIFSDVRVRQAMRMAINADEIVSGVWKGDLVVPCWTDFYREPYTCDVPKPEYDLEGAQALLEEAGWVDTDGDGVRECHGCTTGAPEGYEMRVEFLTYTEWGETLELAHQLIAEDLAEMGMATDLGLVEGSLLWDTYENGGIEQTGNYDLDMWDDGYPGNQITDFLWVYYHTDAMQPDYGYNIVRWSNEEFDALLDESYTLDQEYRKELFCQMAEILDEELPCIPLFYSRDATGYSARLNDVIHNPNSMVTWNIADWTLNE